MRCATADSCVYEMCSVQIQAKAFPLFSTAWLRVIPKKVFVFCGFFFASECVGFVICVFLCEFGLTMLCVCFAVFFSSVGSSFVNTCVGGCVNTIYPSPIFGFVCWIRSHRSLKAGCKEPTKCVSGFNSR
jgi:hypothetical protein